MNLLQLTIETFDKNVETDFISFAKFMKNVATRSLNLT